MAGLIGLQPEVGTTILGYQVLGSDVDLPELAAKYSCAVVTVGQIKTPDTRIRLFDMLRRTGCSIPSIISPHAYVSPHASIGDGSIVLHGAVVNAGSVVGVNCILNSQSLVEHDAVIGDHCHIATGAVVNSSVHIGAGTFLGSGSTVRQCLQIGERCVIGMCQRILGDCPAGTRLPPHKAHA